jgi:hypothetical protein
VVEGAHRLSEELKKKDEELRLASYIADGPHHYKAYFTHEIHGKQRDTLLTKYTESSGVPKLR